MSGPVSPPSHGRLSIVTPNTASTTTAVTSAVRVKVRRRSSAQPNGQQLVGLDQPVSIPEPDSLVKTHNPKHLFQPIDSIFPVSCFVCDRFISKFSRNSGLRCRTCGLSLHNTCQAYSPAICPKTLGSDRPIVTNTILSPTLPSANGVSGGDSAESTEAQLRIRSARAGFRQKRSKKFVVEPAIITKTSLLFVRQRFKSELDDPTREIPIYLKALNIFCDWLQSTVEKFVTEDGLPVIELENVFVAVLQCLTGEHTTSDAVFSDCIAHFRSVLFDSEFYRHVELNVEQLSVKDIADVLTVLGSRLYNRIMPEELQDMAWMKPDKYDRAPNVLACIENFNEQTLFVMTEILDGPKPKQRAEKIVFFMKVALVLRELGNFNSLKAILAGLQSSAVFRLKKTWQLIPSKTRTAFEELSLLVSEQNNFEILRHHMDHVEATARMKHSVVPFLGILLTDLALTGSLAESKKLSVEDLNFREAGIIRKILSFQQQNRIKPVFALVEWLGELGYDDEEFSYQKSLALEPRKTDKLRTDLVTSEAASTIDLSEESTLLSSDSFLPRALSDAHANSRGSVVELLHKELDVILGQLASAGRLTVSAFEGLDWRQKLAEIKDVVVANAARNAEAWSANTNMASLTSTRSLRSETSLKKRPSTSRPKRLPSLSGSDVKLNLMAFRNEHRRASLAGNDDDSSASPAQLTLQIPDNLGAGSSENSPRYGDATDYSDDSDANTSTHSVITPIHRSGASDETSGLVHKSVLKQMASMDLLRKSMRRKPRARHGSSKSLSTRDPQPVSSTSRNSDPNSDSTHDDEEAADETSMDADELDTAVADHDVEPSHIDAEPPRDHASLTLTDSLPILKQIESGLADRLRQRSVEKTASALGLQSSDSLSAQNSSTELEGAVSSVELDSVDSQSMISHEGPIFTASPYVAAQLSVAETTVHDIQQRSAMMRQYMDDLLSMHKTHASDPHIGVLLGKLSELQDHQHWALWNLTRKNSHVNFPQDDGRAASAPSLELPVHHGHPPAPTTPTSSSASSATLSIAVQPLEPSLADETMCAALVELIATNGGFDPGHEGWTLLHPDDLKQSPLPDLLQQEQHYQMFLRHVDMHVASHNYSTINPQILTELKDDDTPDYRFACFRFELTEKLQTIQSLIAEKQMLDNAPPQVDGEPSAASSSNEVSPISTHAATTTWKSDVQPRTLHFAPKETFTTNTEDDYLETEL